MTNESDATPSANPTTADDLLQWQLPGIDIQAGLATVRGNQSLYRRLLQKFVEGQRNFEEQFKQALARNDYETARRQAHTVKGVAANLGMPGLQESAYRLERACASSGSEIEPALGAMLSELRLVLDALQANL